jgi:hypothetical protein
LARTETLPVALANGHCSGMALPDDADLDKLAEVALALLSLTAFPGQEYTRAWKGFDWDLLALLHERGWIFDPTVKSTSVVFTKEGMGLASHAFAKHFLKKPEDGQ